MKHKTCLTPLLIGAFLLSGPGLARAEDLESPSLLGSEAPKVSNVLFLPGIKGSRLYKAAVCVNSGESCGETKVWEPKRDRDEKDLFLNDDGKGIRADIHTNEGDVLDESFGLRFYASFLQDLASLKDQGTISDWKAVAYDWRLSLDDLLTNGTREDTKIYFNVATSTPYIEQTLAQLAASSQTGKVSIVAHSNGGLLAKALLQKLVEEHVENLVDKIVLVGVPQSGAPQAIGGLLFGYGEALPFDACSTNSILGSLCSLFTSRATARTLAEHAPMAYNLLPSFSYLNNVINPPVTTFSARNSYTLEKDAYGESINSWLELEGFLESKEGGRTKPEVEDIESANVLTHPFLFNGASTHANLDLWMPPSEIDVYELAGWGANTFSGIEFYEQETIDGTYKSLYRPQFFKAGDGVVPATSAHLIDTGGSVHKYWINLSTLRTGIHKYTHGDLFEVQEVRSFIKKILYEEPETSEHVLNVEPVQNPLRELFFFLHSPLTLELYNEEHEVVGEYGEFGDVKYAIVPAEDVYELVMRGQAEGTFSLDIQEKSDDLIVATSTIADVPATANTIATMHIHGSISEAFPLAVDEDGDGTIDIEIPLTIGSTTVYGKETPEESEIPTETSNIEHAQESPSHTSSVHLTDTISLPSSTSATVFAVPQAQEHQPSRLVETQEESTPSVQRIPEDGPSATLSTVDQSGFRKIVDFCMQILRRILSFLPHRNIIWHTYTENI
ncbi:MAG: Lecithin-cholesterol acyltransferase [Parcubacteria group bacterium]|nr:Lecithin-cholesterol acyltransferase [Parcubacteria group bacterium]